MRYEPWDKPALEGLKQVIKYPYIGYEKPSKGIGISREAMNRYNERFIEELELGIEEGKVSSPFDEKIVEIYRELERTKDLIKSLTLHDVYQRLKEERIKWRMQFTKSGKLGPYEPELRVCLMM